MLHGWQARVAQPRNLCNLGIDLVELYKENDRGQVERCYLDVEDAGLLASEILGAVAMIKKGDK